MIRAALWTSPALPAVLLWLAAGCSPPGLAAPRQTLHVKPSEGGAGINQALAALERSGGEVVLSAGTYLVSTPVILHSDHVTLRGAGPATLLKLMPKADCPVVIVGDEAGEPRHTVRGVCVADLRIDGSRARQEDECWGGNCGENEQASLRNSGLVIRRARDILVLRVRADNCRSGGLVTEKGCRRLVVQDFAASGNEFDGLACYQTEDSRFSGLELHRNKSAGISTDLDFNHNLLADVHLFHNGSHGIFMRNSSDNRFDHLQVKHSGRSGIFVDQVDKGRRTASVGNQFNDVRVTHSGGPGVTINAASCKDTRLTHAVLEDNTTGVWAAAPGLVRQEDVSVHGPGSREQVQAEH